MLKQECMENDKAHDAHVDPMSIGKGDLHPLLSEQVSFADYVTCACVILMSNGHIGFHLLVF